MADRHLDTKDIINRLSGAEGLIRAVKKMVEEDKPCDEIILQLAAVEGTVNKLAKIILKEHLNNCVKDSIMKGETDILDNFNSLLDKYIK